MADANDPAPGGGTPILSPRAVVGGISGLLLGSFVGPSSRAGLLVTLLAGAAGYWAGLRASAGSRAANAGVKTIAVFAGIGVVVSVLVGAGIAILIVYMFTRPGARW